MALNVSSPPHSTPFWDMVPFLLLLRISLLTVSHVFKMPWIHLHWLRNMAKVILCDFLSLVLRGLELMLSLLLNESFIMWRSQFWAQKDERPCRKERENYSQHQLPDTKLRPTRNIYPSEVPSDQNHM